MNFKKLLAGLLFYTISVLPALSFAAHPLITDDTGTQGKGKFQLELNGQYDRDREDVDGVSVKNTGKQTAATLSCGIVENVDLVLSIPYQWGKAKENEVTIYNEEGIGDATLETKWRLFEKERFSLALKPGIIIPVGDDEKGLGTGRLGGQIFLIGSQELGAWAFHANLGYIRNENDADEYKDLWHASLAITREVVKNLRFAANIGIERNPDDSTKDDPAFIIGGFIYSLTENFDVDLGVKGGLSKAETDFSLLAGIAFRF